MDNISTEFILDINSQIIAPNLQVAVFADIDSIQSRLAGRKELTRFELGNKTAVEILNMNEGLAILENEHIDILTIDNTMDLDKNVTKITEFVVAKLEKL